MEVSVKEDRSKLKDSIVEVFMIASGSFFENYDINVNFEDGSTVMLKTVGSWSAVLEYTDGSLEEVTLSDYGLDKLMDKLNSTK